MVGKIHDSLPGHGSRLKKRERLEKHELAYLLASLAKCMALALGTKEHYSEETCFGK